MPKLDEPGYDFAAFLRELTGGSLRWVASVLAAAAAALLVILVAGWAPAAVPWFLRGALGIAIVGMVLAIWTVLAVVNWAAHASRAR